MCWLLYLVKVASRYQTLNIEWLQILIQQSKHSFAAISLFRISNLSSSQTLKKEFDFSYCKHSHVHIKVSSGKNVCYAQQYLNHRKNISCRQEGRKVKKGSISQQKWQCFPCQNYTEKSSPHLVRLCL